MEMLSVRAQTSKLVDQHFARVREIAGRTGLLLNHLINCLVSNNFCYDIERNKTRAAFRGCVTLKTRILLQQTRDFQLPSELDAVSEGNLMGKLENLVLYANFSRV